MFHVKHDAHPRTVGDADSHKGMFHVKRDEKRRKYLQFACGNY